MRGLHYFVESNVNEQKHIKKIKSQSWKIQLGHQSLSSTTGNIAAVLSDVKMKDMARV